MYARMFSFFHIKVGGVNPIPFKEDIAFYKTNPNRRYAILLYKCVLCLFVFA